MSRKRHTAADERYFLIRTLAAELPHGHSLAPHTHSWGQLIYALSGVMSVQTEQGSWVAPPHWAIWAPAGIAHAIRFAGETSIRTLYLRPSRWEHLPPRSAVIAVSPLLRELIVRTVDSGMLDEREPLHMAMAELIVGELHAHTAPEFDLPMPKSANLRRIAERLSLMPADRSDHATLAAQSGMSVRSLERSFEDETGLSLGRWRRQVRLLAAMRLLGAGASVKQAASETGYRSASAFIAAFRATLGTTPGKYFDTER